MSKWSKGVSSKYDALRLPNAGEKTQTPASLKIDLHYAHLQIYERWDWDRFQRLAAFLNVTPFELGSIACVTHKHIENFKRTNRLIFGRSPNRAAAMVLTLLEHHCCKAYCNDVIENPFPRLSGSESAKTASMGSMPSLAKP